MVTLLCWCVFCSMYEAKFMQRVESILCSLLSCMLNLSVSHWYFSWHIHLHGFGLFWKKTSLQSQLTEGPGIQTIKNITRVFSLHISSRLDDVVSNTTDSWVWAVIGTCSQSPGSIINDGTSWVDSWNLKWFHMLKATVLLDLFLRVEMSPL